MSAYAYLSIRKTVDTTVKDSYSWPTPTKLKPYFPKLAVMALFILFICSFLSWVLSTVVMKVPHFLGWLVPPPWLLLGTALVLITWLMRD